MNNLFHNFNYLKYYCEEDDFLVYYENFDDKICNENIIHVFSILYDINRNLFYRKIIFDKKEKLWIIKDNNQKIEASSQFIPLSKYLFPTNWINKNNKDITIYNYIADYYNIRTYHQISGINKYFKYKYNVNTKMKIIKILLILNRFFDNKELNIPIELKDIILNNIRPIDLNIILQN